MNAVLRATASAVLSVLLLACSTGAQGGSGDSSASADSDIPSSQSDRLEWKRLAPVPTERTEVTAAARRGQIYVIGGFARSGTVATVEIYDVSSDSWSDGPPLPVAVNHAMAATLGGRVYVAGGYLGPGVDNPTDSAFVLSGDRWRPIARLPDTRAAGGLVAARGRLYLVGGVEDDHLANETFVYNPRRNRWTPRPVLPETRQHLGAAGVRKRVYVVGGREHGLDTNTGRSDRFNPRTRRWSSIPRMPTPRGGLAAASTLGFVVAAGGEAERTFDEVEAFDARSGRWRSLPNMPTARHGLGVVAVGSVVYVLAGGPEPGLTYSDANEALDLAPLRER